MSTPWKIPVGGECKHSNGVWCHHLVLARLSECNSRERIRYISYWICNFFGPKLGDDPTKCLSCLTVEKVKEVK
jgi:hypothetical protein